MTCRPHKTQIFFNNIRLMYTLCFLVAPVKLKVYKKVVKFSFKQQKIFWVLVFRSIYLVLVDAMDKSKMSKNCGCTRAKYAPVATYWLSKENNSAKNAWKKSKFPFFKKKSSMEILISFIFKITY